MEVNVKYLKDEDGNVISPVTSSSSISMLGNSNSFLDRIVYTNTIRLKSEYVNYIYLELDQTYSDLLGVKIFGNFQEAGTYSSSSTTMAVRLQLDNECPAAFYLTDQRVINGTSGIYNTSVTNSSSSGTDIYIGDMLTGNGNHYSIELIRSNLTNTWWSYHAEMHCATSTSGEYEVHNVYGQFNHDTSLSSITISSATYYIYGSMTVIGYRAI